MVYNINIISDTIIIKNFSDDLPWYNDFTLTANAVNDAPDLLQPLEVLEIIEGPEAAAVVLYNQIW